MNRAEFESLLVSTKSQATELKLELMRASDTNGRLTVKEIETYEADLDEAIKDLSNAWTYLQMFRTFPRIEPRTELKIENK